MFVAHSGYGTYRPSDENLLDPSPPPVLGPDPFGYGGAQKLAEALVGWDLLGYHPESAFRSDGFNTDRAGQQYLVYDPRTRQNVDEREGPYIELENANAFKMGDIYSNIGAFNPDNYVLCDVFTKMRTGLGGVYGSKKTGMPILYYRARTANFEQTYGQALPPAGPDGIDDDIYYYRDNVNLLALGTPDGTAHILDGSDNAVDWQRFEEMILNDEITTLNRPYRAGSYILISAGKDGLYGTADDLTNFTKE